LTLTPLFQGLPQATLAAVVIAAVVELVDVPALAALYQVYTRRLGRYYGVAARPDFIAAVAALVGVLVFDTLPGLFIGIAISVPLPLHPAAPPRGAAGPRARPASTATWNATPTTSSSPASSSYGWRAACSSPTPTRSDKASAPTPPPRAPGWSCWTPRPPPPSASPPPTCSPNSPRAWNAGASGCWSAARSARSATWSARWQPTPHPKASTRRSRPPSRPPSNPQTHREATATLVDHGLGDQ